MQTSQIEQFLAKRQSEISLPVRLYALVDGLLYSEAGVADLQRSSSTTALFDSTADAPLANAGPWLIDVEQASPSVHTALYTLASGPTGISWLISAYPAPSLAQELRTRLDVRMPDGRTALLRFYDARIVRNIAALLSSSQRTEFFVPTFDWITQINDRLTRVHPDA